jgi:hypothetical protein
VILARRRSGLELADEVSVGEMLRGDRTELTDPQPGAMLESAGLDRS